MSSRDLFQPSRPIVYCNPRESRRIDPRFAYSRLGGGYFMDADGILKLAPANQPRLRHHDPTTLEYLGFLREPERTNFFAHSESDVGINIAGSTMTKTGASGVTPINANTAVKLQDTAQSIAGINQHTLGEYTLVEGEPYAFSRFFKAVPGSTVNYVTTSFGGNTVFIDVRTGEITRTELKTGLAFVHSYPDGWFRVGVTFISDVPSSTAYGRMTSDPVGTGYTPNGNGSVLVTGNQVEAGWGASSYIPTYGATVTRPADLLTYSGGALPDSLSIYIDARILFSTADECLLSASNAGDTETLRLKNKRLSTTNVLAYEVNDTFLITYPMGVPIDQREKHIVTTGANNYHLRKETARSTPSAVPPTGLSKIGIGHDVTDPTKGVIAILNSVSVWENEIDINVAEALVRNELSPINASTYNPITTADSMILLFDTQAGKNNGNKSILIGVRPDGAPVDVVVNWGDGEESVYRDPVSEIRHTYEFAGIYRVTVTGSLGRLHFNDKSDADTLIELVQWGAAGPLMFRAPTTMRLAFWNCTNLKITAVDTIPDTSAVQDFNGAFRECHNLTTIPNINTNSATSMVAMHKDNYQVTNLPFYNTANVTNMDSFTSGCYNLLSFREYNTANVTSLASVCDGCASLSEFPFINTAQVTTVRLAWRYNAFTTFPNLNLSSCTQFDYAWDSCRLMGTFPGTINTANGQNFHRSWYLNDDLVSFPALTFTAAVTFPSTNGGLGGFYFTWGNCYLLTTFPANMFNNVVTNHFQDAFVNCALTAQSIENILVSINVGNTSNGRLGIGGGSNAAKTTWSTAANTAFNLLVARGWTITYNP